MRRMMTGFRTYRWGRTLQGKIVTALLAVGFWVAALGCQLPPQPRAPSDTKARQLSAAPSTEHGFFARAVVRAVNRSTGLVDLETEVGSFYAIADKEDLARLQEGDEITIYIVDENAPVVRV